MGKKEYPPVRDWRFEVQLGAPPEKDERALLIGNGRTNPDEGRKCTLGEDDETLDVALGQCFVQWKELRVLTKRECMEFLLQRRWMEDVKPTEKFIAELEELEASGKSSNTSVVAITLNM